MQPANIARLSLGYVLISSCYILFSDMVLFGLFPDLQDVHSVSVVKGLGFVVVTGVFLAGYLGWLQRSTDAWRQALLQNHQAIIILFDPVSASIVDASPGACDFYGWSLEQLRGMKLWDINVLPEADVRALLAGNTGSNNRYRFQHRSANGEVHDVVVQNGPIQHHGQNLSLSIIQDISDFQHSAAELRRLRCLHELLSSAGELAMQAQNREQYFQALCDLVVDKAGLRFAWIGLIDARGAVLPVASAGNDDGYIAQIKAHLESTDGRAGGPTAQALRTGQRIVINDFLHDSVTQPWHDAARAVGVRASAALPFRSGGELLGTLNLYADEVGFFGDLEASTLDNLAQGIGFALDSLQRMQELTLTAAIVASSQVVLYRWSGAPGRPVLFITRNVERFGFTVAAILSGKVTFDQIVHPDDSARVEAELEYYLAEKRSYFRQQYRLRTPDGELHWVQDDTEAVRDHAGNLLYFQSAITDVTEVVRVRQALHDSDERYRSMVVHSPDVIMVVRHELVHYINPAGIRLLGNDSDERLLGRPLQGLLAPSTQAVLQERLDYVRGGSGRVVPFVAATLLSLNGEPLDMEVSASSFLEDDSLDILIVCRDVRFKHEAEATIQRYLKKLEAAVHGTTLAISQMVELRDPYTAGHERRVGELGAAIAARMGLDENTCKGLRIAGAVHDVGKIMVPVEILTKPSRLTALEMALVQTHAEHGYEVLSKVDYPWPIAEVARQHHERLDGNGYPRGLKGDEILLEARIIAVADVVESMTSDRPYRPGLGIEKALDEITQGRTVRYDERVVDECLALFREDGYSFEIADAAADADKLQMIG